MPVPPALLAGKRSFVIADTARPDSKVYSAIIQSGIWAATMRDIAPSARNKPPAHEGAKLAPKESSETDFPNGAAGDDRRNWLFWLAS
jgi:hypothetical protein